MDHKTQKAVVTCLAWRVCPLPEHHGRIVANLMLNDLFALLKERDMEVKDVSKELMESFADIAALRSHEMITTRHAKQILAAVFDEPWIPVSDYIVSSKLLEEADDSAIVAIIHELMAANEKMCQQIRDGKTNVVGFFVGQTLKKIKADPGKVKALLNKEFDLP